MSKGCSMSCPPWYLAMSAGSSCIVNMLKVGVQLIRHNLLGGVVQIGPLLCRQLLTLHITAPAPSSFQRVQQGNLLTRVKAFLHMVKSKSIYSFSLLAELPMTPLKCWGLSRERMGVGFSKQSGQGNCIKMNYGKRLTNFTGHSIL